MGTMRSTPPSTRTYHPNFEVWPLMHGAIEALNTCERRRHVTRLATSKTFMGHRRMPRDVRVATDLLLNAGIQCLN
jgi:hypothetical protein